MLCITVNQNVLVQNSNRINATYIMVSCVLHVNINFSHFEIIFAAYTDFVNYYTCLLKSDRLWCQKMCLNGTTYQSFAVADSHFVPSSSYGNHLSSVMTMINLVMKFRRAVTTNFDLKIGRKKLIINCDVQMKILTKRWDLKEDGFFRLGTVKVSLSPSVPICQVTW